MPVILDENPTGGNGGKGSKKTMALYSPKDYNSILTGNGVNQGLLRSTLPVEGTYDITPQHVKTIIRQHEYDALNRSYHYHDDKTTYTVLFQNMSLCRGYIYNPNQQMHLPSNLIKDHLATFEASGQKIIVNARMFLDTLYVYKGTNNYALPILMLAVDVVNNPRCSFVLRCDTLDEVITGASGSSNYAFKNNPIKTMFERAMSNLKALITKYCGSNYICAVDNSMALADFYINKTMYDLIMDELAIIKTPGVLKDTLTELSKDSFSALKGANDILALINIPFALYQSDVIDVVNSIDPKDAQTLKNANMSLSLADTLSAMQNKSNAVIPELTGKHYTTNQITLTTEQIAAIETDTRVTVVAAGAGTGKSSCVIHRLTFMEENNCDMKETYVLSFTKNAAGHIKKLFKDCKSMTIAEFTHNFVNVILDDGTGKNVDIISHSDFVQKLKIHAKDLEQAHILSTATTEALNWFVRCAETIDRSTDQLLNMFDINMEPEANNLLSILKMMHCSSLELDPIIFHSQLAMLKPNIQHIVIDESQDSNRLEFLTMLKMAMMHDISLYVVGDCAQTLYEFRDADPRILNNLTKLFNTFDLSINHRSTQIILDVANLMSSTMTTHKTTLKSNTIQAITQKAIDDTITISTYAKVTDPATMKTLDNYLEAHLGQGESIAVIARSGNDVNKLYEYIQSKYGATWNVQNITSQRRNDICILSHIGDNLDNLFPYGQHIQGWPEFEQAIKTENLRLNANTRRQNRYTANGPTLNKVTLEWLADEKPNGADIVNHLNGTPDEHDAEIRRLQLSLLDTQTKKNNTLQRVMDAKNAKLKTQKADIIVCTVHGVKGLEYDHVACFINTESGYNSYGSGSDENKRIAYVALTRAKLTECIFCTREKLLKDFEAYRATKP